MSALLIREKPPMIVDRKPMSFAEMRAKRLEMDAPRTFEAPAPAFTAREWADLSLCDHLIEAEKREREWEEEHNARLKARIGSLPRPEPKSIHSPAGKPMIRFVPPVKRGEGRTKRWAER